MTTAWGIFFAIVLLVRAFGWSGGKTLVKQSYGEAREKTAEQSAARKAKRQAKRHPAAQTSALREHDPQHEQRERDTEDRERRDQTVLGRSELATGERLLDAPMTHGGVADKDQTDEREADARDRIGPARAVASAGISLPAPRLTASEVRPVRHHAR